MSELPKGWTIAALGELGTWRGGGTPSKGVPAFWTGDVPWVSPKDMKVERIRDSIDHISQDAVERSATSLVRAGSVLVVTRSGILSHSLPVAVTEREVALNQDLKALEPAAGILPEFVAWVLRSMTSVVLHTCSKSGTTVSNIDTNRLLALQIPLAPTLEQRRIVAAIEEQFSRLDASDASLERARHLLALFRAIASTEPFSGEWPVEALADVNDPERPIRYGILMPKAHVDGGVLYVRVRDYPKGVVVLSGLRRTSVEIAAKYRRSTLRSGDVLLAIRGTYGRVAIVPAELDGANITQDTARIAPIPPLDARFLAAYLRSDEAQRYFRSVARGVAVKGVNIGDLRTMPIPVPPPDEQHEIVARVEEHLSAIDALRAAMERAQRRSASLRRAVLERAFRGELVPQDPSDEPASALLERIRAERASAPVRQRRRRVGT